MEKTTIKAYKGDTINIPIVATTEAGATLIAQLRQSSSSTTYYSLTVEGSIIQITAAQSASLAAGTWYAELQQTLDGEITTLQRTIVLLKEDVTKTSGTAAPTKSDLENYLKSGYVDQSAGVNTILFADFDFEPFDTADYIPFVRGTIAGGASAIINHISQDENGFTYYLSDDATVYWQCTKI